ncbi:MAG: T9SS type A sorting domain-containing protein, partial [Chitinophagaceae bacterium]|nr:T9SS type A sorting domain-containing protein [Chitinophagaceae bacterium]
LLISSILAFSALTFSSYMTGPANNSIGNVTGSPKANGTCAQAGCHSGGVFTAPSGTIELRKKSTGLNGPLVTSYEAGEVYYVTLTGAATSSHFGFQTVALKKSDSSEVGTYGGFSANAHGYPSAIPTIAEHKVPVAKTALDMFETKFEWTAPSSGVGAITMYAIFTAVNNDGLSTGDVVGTTFSLNLVDKTSVGQVSKEVVFKTYPNPVQDILTLDMNKAEEGYYDITVYSYTGAIVSQSKLYISPAKYTGTFNTSNWAPGNYFMQIHKDGSTRVMPIVKQ